MFVVIDELKPVVFDNVNEFLKAYKNKSSFNITKIISSKKCMYIKDIINNNIAYVQNDNGLEQFNIDLNTVIIINKSNTMKLGNKKYQYYNVTSINDNTEYNILLPII